MRNFAVGFFSDVPTSAAISRIAEADHITIFAGAGVCLDQGVPGWNHLVSRLLDKRLEDSSIDAAMVGSVSAHLLEQYREVPTATIVDALYSDQLGVKAAARRIDDIRSVIYESGQNVGLASPSLVERTLLLAHALHVAGRNVHIITTNYDDLFEYVSAERLSTGVFKKWGVNVVPYSERPPATHRVEDLIPVVHIHGFVPRAGSNVAPPILSEKDYFEWDANSPFRNYLSVRFGAGAVLFLGSSLRDANILRRLSAARSDHVSAFALLPVQSESVHYPKDMRPVAETLAGYAESRGRELGVEVLRPNFFGQVYQFLDEVRAKVSEPTDYVPYVRRLDEWTDRWYQSGLHVDEAHRRTATLRARQTSAELVQIVGSVSKAKVELWVRRPNEERSLELWASSQGMWIPGDEHWPKTVSLVGPLQHAAVNCFAMGTTTQGRVSPLDRTRWTHYVATPVNLPGNYASLTVGVSIALFHAPDHARAEQLPSVDQNLDVIGTQLLAYGRELLQVRD